MNSNVIQVHDFQESTVDLTSTLGIKPEIFRDSIQSGLLFYKGVNKFHPVTAGGSRAWEEIVSMFRSSVIDQGEGWKAVQQNGIPMLVNSDLGISVVVTSGDENTGLISGEEPKTRNAKGHVTQGYVGQNYNLFEETPTVTTIDRHQTWVLLYTFDKTKLEVRYELSLPTGASISGNKGKMKISEWQTRVVFTAIPFTSVVIPTSTQEFTDDSDFFAVVKK